jgi:hypothetical protein
MAFRGREEDHRGMTMELPHRPHQCPCCELRFAWRTELEEHVVTVHEVLGTGATSEERPRPVR